MITDFLKGLAVLIGIALAAYGCGKLGYCVGRYDAVQDFACGQIQIEAHTNTVITFSEKEGKR